MPTPYYTSQQISKMIAKKLINVPVEFPNTKLAIGIDTEVLGDVPQIDFMLVTAPKLPPPETNSKSEIMQKVLKSIGGEK
jgi:hypothetical protein